MADNMGIKLAIGAALASSVGSSFGSIVGGATKAQKATEKIVIGKALVESIAKNESLLAKLHAQMEKTGRTASKIDLDLRLIADISAARTETDKLGMSFKNADKEAAKLGRQLKESNAREAFGAAREKNKTMRREGATDVAVGIGAAYTFKKLIDESIQFESVMADVNKVVDFETPEQFKQMQQDILDMSKTMPMAASGIGQIVAAAGQAGIARNELKAFASDAIKMGIAFDLSAEEAGSSMTGIRSIFKLTQDQAVGLGDTINYLSNSMDARASQIVDIANRTGSVGIQFGFTGDQVAALGATFLALKTPPEIASTGIKTLFMRLATAKTQTKEFQQGLHSIGLSAGTLQKAIKNDAQGALIDFLNRVKTAKDPLTVISQMFGTENAASIAKLVDNVGMYEKSVALASDTTAKAGSMQKEYQTRSATTANNIQLMTNRMQESAIKLGGTFLPVLNEVLTPVGKLGSAVSDAAQAHPALFRGIMTVTAAAIGLKIVIGGGKFFGSYISDGWAAIKFLRAYDFATKAATVKTVAFGIAQKAQRAGAVVWGLITKASWLFNASLWANPIVWIGAAFVGAGILIYKYWEPISGFFKKLFGGISEDSEKATDSLGKVVGKTTGIKDAAKEAGGLGSIVKDMGMPDNVVAQMTGGGAGAGVETAKQTPAMPSVPAEISRQAGPLTISIAGITIQTQSVDAASVPGLAKDIASQVMDQIGEKMRQNKQRGFGDAVVAW